MVRLEIKQNMVQNEWVYDSSTNAELSYLMLLILMGLWDGKELRSSADFLCVFIINAASPFISLSNLQCNFI